jgi:hypothetical protein
MKKKLYLSIVFCFCIAFLNAQSDIDAFRFSQNNWEGTARFMGAGGAFGAVGAEFSALSTNPASIGIFKKNEVSFTPVVISVFNTKTNYYNTDSRYLSTNYSLSNFGMIFKTEEIPNSKWKGIQFGFGYNRINDFNNTIREEGTSIGSSMTDAFINNANSTNYQNLYGDNLVAWQAWLIDTLTGDDNHYYSPFSGSNLAQSKYTKTSGGIDEMDFSVGGNYDDQVYVGATIGVPFLNYKEISDYEETDEEMTVEGMESYKIHDELNVKGTGINLKLGILYQPFKFMRIGVAFHTPTYYSNLSDNFSRKITSYDDAGEEYTASYENKYNYKLTTPLRAIGSLAFFINKRAFISAEYEFVDYGMAYMYADDYSFAEENMNIQDKYGISNIVRVGTEVYLSENFLVRLGYNFKSSPYRDEINTGISHQGSVGFGIRTKSFFFDLAYILKYSRESYWLYNPELVEASDNTYINHKVFATFGFKF